MPERRSWLNEPMSWPVLVTLMELNWLGRMVTTSAEAIGSSVAPSDIIGWPKARMCAPSTCDTVPVPAMEMSPRASATATTPPGCKDGGAATAEDELEGESRLPPRALKESPRDWNCGASRAAICGESPPAEN